ncbi:DNA polymerase III subunit gamma/tau [Aliihoeflea sp. 40Bstr573]|uniref:DNA polymerase III subunit gamma/tau n=1 Tax=Aliihoeflea sp. 40Bstr573 TaxID=2696467 RepID=UPI0020961226|nr:DNA polymerase III subunit gamma/tau [Aliihoeflea sp. 40Bstr573]MCO6387573.1 DNA polymerase III subunit gamma/tau [Aliihoeflea sp. 40Bstr573]
MDQAPDKDQSRPSGPYRVLARKYRPRDFSTLIGQEPMVRTLTNAFATGRIAQAWMLTGVRGVGKTTTARILARALNYKTDAVSQPTVDLSVAGEHCEAIMEGRHVDVVEMDAASHTGIDDIREIIEQVRYAPVSARYKVYLIDEVHMLSTQAFNGLLKTLEEPPPHVKFIFATTEIRKVPITVLSRCQRFDLRRVDAGLLTAHLRGIAQKEDVAIDDDALAMIARAAEGSVRDSLSILDQAIAHGSGTVTAGAVRDMLGLADRARVIDLFELLMKGDVAGALGEFRGQYDAGADPATVLTDLAEFNHLVTRIRFVPNAADDASISQEERQRGREYADGLSVRVLSRTWQMLLKGIAEVQTASRPVSAAEMVLIRIAHAATLPTLDEALKSLDGEASARNAPQSPTPPGTGGAASRAPASVDAIATQPVAVGLSGGGQTMRLVRTEPEPLPVAVPQPKVEEAPAGPRIASMTDLVALCDANRDMALKVQIKQFLRPVRFDPGRIEVSLTEHAPRMLVSDLTTRLHAWTGRRWIVTVSRERGGDTLSEIEQARRDVALLDARNDPSVAAILARFPGAKIIDVRLPDAAEAPEIEIESDEVPVDPGIGDLDDDDEI